MKQHGRLPAAVINNPWKIIYQKSRVCMHKSVNKGTGCVTSSLCMPVRTIHKPRGLRLWVSFMLNQPYTGLLNPYMCRCFYKDFGLQPHTQGDPEKRVSTRQKCVQWHISELPISQQSWEPVKEKSCGCHRAVRSWFILWGGKKTY